MTQTETFLGITTSSLEYEPIQERHIFALFSNVWYFYYVVSNPQTPLSPIAYDWLWLSNSVDILKNRFKTYLM